MLPSSSFSHLCRRVLADKFNSFSPAVIWRLGAVRWLKKPRSKDRPMPSTAQDFRTAIKLPVNRTSRGALTDAADFSFVDGRPAPPSTAQLRRAQQNRDTMEKIVQLLEEIEFSKKFYADRVRQAEIDEQELQNSLLMPKGEKTLE